MDQNKRSRVSHVKRFTHWIRQSRRQDQLSCRIAPQDNIENSCIFSNSCSKSSEIMSSASNAEWRAAPNQVALICSLAETEKRTGQRSKLLPTSQKQLSVLETVPTTSYTSLTAPIFDSYGQTVLSKYSQRA